MSEQVNEWTELRSLAPASLHSGEPRALEEAPWPSSGSHTRSLRNASLSPKPSRTPQSSCCVVISADMRLITKYNWEFLE